MKTIIVYSSQTGNTLKLAKHIKTLLQGNDTLYAIDDVPVPEGDEVIFLGFWLQAGKPDMKTQQYLKQIKNQKLFLFCTHGAAVFSDHAQNAIKVAKEMAPHAEILGTFNCQGEVNPKILEKASAKASPPVWLKDAPDAKGHPDDKDLDALSNAVNQCLKNIVEGV
jgi:flavodoxin